MAKSLVSAQTELKNIGIPFYGDLLNYRGGLEIILNNLEEEDEIKGMVTGIHKRSNYLICVTESKIVCAVKSLTGKQKEMIIKTDDIKSIEMKSPFLAGHNIIISLKDASQLKFNSDEKKNITRFVTAASACLA